MQHVPIKTYANLADALVRRRHEIGLSQVDMDHLTGLADGYVAKIECGAKRLGPLSLPCILDVLGVSLILVPDTHIPGYRHRQASRHCCHPLPQSYQRVLDFDEVAA